MPQSLSQVDTSKNGDRSQRVSSFGKNKVQPYFSRLNEGVGAPTALSLFQHYFEVDQGRKLALDGLLRNTTDKHRDVLYARSALIFYNGQNGVASVLYRTVR
jgi:hypothetical protein